MAAADQVEVHGGIATKRHAGDDGVRRAAVAAAAMDAAHAGGLPVPEVLLLEASHLQTRAVDGRNGIVLLERSPRVLLGHIGRFARRLHRLTPPDGLPVDDPHGVWIHGDLCPVHMRVGAVTDELIAVLDWEHSRIGDPVEDLAWTEWHVRNLHMPLVGSLRWMYDAYGATPAPAARLAAMERILRRQLEAAEDERDRAVWRFRLSMLGDLDLDVDLDCDLDRDAAG